ncbi:MAG TPA: glycerol-3-phosphate 1-O-acyltransferase PlsY [Candidatus Obscuribacterales bacterium]
MVWAVGSAVLLAAYLLGAITTGYIVAKMLQGIDIREHGSGNTGATNVFRVVGKGAGFTVLAIDLLKGLLAVLLAKGILAALGTAMGPETVPWWVTGAGLLAIVGHSRSIWLNWTGGKSAATGLGVLLALYWPVGVGTAAVFGVMLAVFRIVSLGSIAAAIAAAVLMVVLQQPLAYGLLAIAGSLYVILRHRANIQRLLAGTEPRFGQRPSN